MDRKSLIELFRRGMNYPPGRHRFWISRCFEVIVRPDSVVELDEYEGFATQDGKAKDGMEPPHTGQPNGMFHVGHSVLNLRDGSVIEEAGRGWGSSPAKVPKGAKKA